MPRGITRDFLRLDLEHAEFGRDAQPALLRHDQQFAVGVVEKAPLHRAVRGIDVNADAGLRRRAAIAGHGEQAVDEIGRRGRQRQRIPAQLVRRDRRLVEIVVESSTLQQRERPCTAAGRMRYSQLRRFTWRGAVNAVPEICSAYRPCATRCGELRPPAACRRPPRSRIRWRSRIGSRAFGSTLASEFAVARAALAVDTARSASSWSRLRAPRAPSARARSTRTAPGNCLRRSRRCPCAG